MNAQQIAKRVKQLEALCRQQGVPLTVQRRAVLEAVLERDDHPTADQVVEIAKDRVPGISRTTVYRVLDMLADTGLVRRLHHPGPAVRYDGEAHRHHHLICKICLHVIDWEDARLNRLRPPDVADSGFEIEDFSVHFMGICEKCRKARRKASRQR